MIPLRPTSLPGWASGASGWVAEPTASQKALGWQPNQAPPSSYQNWLHNLTYGWLSYLDTNYSTWSEHLLFSTSSNGPTSATGGLSNYSQLALLMSASAAGYSMLDPGLGDARAYPNRAMQLNGGLLSGEYAYLASTNKVYSANPSGLDFELTMDFDPRVVTDAQELRIGLSNSQVGHSGTTYAMLVRPTSSGQWFLTVNSNNITTASAILATGFNAIAFSSALQPQTYKISIDNKNHVTYAYVNDVLAAQVNTTPSGSTGLYIVEGVRNYSTTSFGYVGIGKFKARWGI